MVADGPGLAAAGGAGSTGARADAARAGGALMMRRTKATVVWMSALLLHPPSLMKLLITRWRCTEVERGTRGSAIGNAAARTQLGVIQGWRRMLLPHMRGAPHPCWTTACGSSRGHPPWLR